MLMISFSENVLVEPEWLFTKYNMSLPNTRYLYLRWLFLFYETQLDQHPFRVGNSCVEVRVVKCFNAIAGGEFFKMHI